MTGIDTDEGALALAAARAREQGLDHIDFVHSDIGTYRTDASYDAVRISTKDRKVIAGSASFDLTAHHTVTGAGSNNTNASFEVHAAITFQADHTATLVLDGTQHYTIDLTTGIVVHVN